MNTKCYLLLLLVMLLGGVSKVTTARADGTYNTTNDTYLGPNNATEFATVFGSNAVTYYYDDASTNLRWYFCVRNVYSANLYVAASDQDAVLAGLDGKISDGTYGNLDITTISNNVSSTSGYTSAKVTYNGTTYTYYYTVNNNGTMAIVYAVAPLSGNSDLTNTSTYTTSNLYNLTIPDEISVTGSCDGSTPTTTTYTTTMIGMYATTDNTTFTHYIGDCITVPFKLTLNKSLQYISRFAFSYVTDLYELDWTNSTSLAGIYADAFIGCENMTLTDATLPSTVTVLGDYAFSGTTIRNLTISHEVSQVGVAVFADCNNMEYLDLSATSGMTDIYLSRGKYNDSGLSGHYAGYLYKIPAHTIVYAPYDINAAYQDETGTSTGYNIVYKNSSNSLVCNHFYVYESDAEASKGTDAYNYGYDVRIPSTLAYTSGSSNLSAGFTATLADYNRTFAAGWSTMYLPYPTTLPSGVTAYEFAGRGDLQDNKMYAYAFQEVSDPQSTALAANHPYLLYSASSFTLPQQKNVTVSATPNNDPTSSSTTYNYYDTSNSTETSASAQNATAFLGSTEDIEHSAVTGWNAYTLSANTSSAANDQKWRLIKDTSSNTGMLARFRAFIADNASTSSGAKASSVGIILYNLDGTTTEISSPVINAKTSVDTRIYTLDGRLVSGGLDSLPRGIYVMNGKKVIKK